MAVDLEMCYSFECEKCGNKNLIFESPRRGDSVQCAHCKKKDKVDGITGPYRSGDSPLTTLDCMIPSDVR